MWQIILSNNFFEPSCTVLLMCLFSFLKRAVSFVVVFWNKRVLTAKAEILERKTQTLIFILKFMSYKDMTLKKIEKNTYHRLLRKHQHIYLLKKGIAAFKCIAAFKYAAVHYQKDLPSLTVHWHVKILRGE